MTERIDRPSPGELVADLQRIGAVTDVIRSEIRAVTEATPWGIGLALQAVRATKKLRFDRFLKAMHEGANALGQDAQVRFRDWVSSEEGQELLTDYAETTVRTGSQTAIAALGLLYANPDYERYPLSFRRLACEALEGIGDDLVSMFIAFVEAADRLLAQPREGNSRTFKVDGGIVDTSLLFPVVLPYEQTLAQNTGAESARLYASLQHLVSRGLLLPDPATGRFGGDPALAFGIGPDTRRFQELLTRARALLAPSEPGDPDATV